MVTVSRFVPIEEMDSVTEAVVPCPMATSTMTLITPMITLIPLLTLGIPGDTNTAVLLGALGFVSLLAGRGKGHKSA